MEIGNDKEQSNGELGNREGRRRRDKRQAVLLGSFFLARNSQPDGRGCARSRLLDTRMDLHRGQWHRAAPAPEY